MKKIRGEIGAMPRGVKTHPFLLHIHSQISSILVLKQVMGQAKESFGLLQPLWKAKEFIWQICLRISLMLRTPGSNSALLIWSGQVYEKIKLISSLTYKPIQTLKTSSICPVKMQTFSMFLVYYWWEVKFPQDLR